MSEIKDGGQAFPMPMTMMTAEHIANEPEYGMTLRDYFAAKAMQALLEDCIPDRVIDGGPYKGKSESVVIAYRAYLVADEMLKARKS